MSSSISKAQLYLENELNQLTDPYELAIVTYALHLANSPQKDNALRLLEQRAITGTHSSDRIIALLERNKITY